MTDRIAILGSTGSIGTQAIAVAQAHGIRVTALAANPRVEELVRQAQLDEGPILSLKEVERREIQRAIAQYGTTTQGKRMAAKELGIGLATLYRKLEELGI